MNASGKQFASNPSRNTKADLQKELVEAREKITLLENELAVYKAESKKSEQKLASLKSECDSLKEKLEAHAMQNEALNAKLEDARKINRQYREEKEKLQQDLQTAEEMLAEQTESGKKELRKAEEQRLALEQKIVLLESTVEELQAKLTSKEKDYVVLPEEGAAPKSSFRIDLYPHQGHFRGKIEHMLSKDKKVFSNLNEPGILDFMYSHLPRAQEGVKAADRESLPAGTLPADRASIEEMKIVPATVIHHRQPFQVQLTAAISEKLKEPARQIRYKASVFAKKLARGGERQLIAETENTLAEAGTFAIHVAPNVLSPGFYRLEVAVSFNAEKGEPSPIAAFLESGLIEVY